MAEPDDKRRFADGDGARQSGYDPAAIENGGSASEGGGGDNDR